MSDTTGKKRECGGGGGGGRPEGVKGERRQCLKRDWGGRRGRERGREGDRRRERKKNHTEGREKPIAHRGVITHISQKCARVFKKGNICEALGALKGKCGNWLRGGGGRRGERGEDQWMMSLR